MVNLSYQCTAASCCPSLSTVQISTRKEKALSLGSGQGRLLIQDSIRGSKIVLQQKLGKMIFPALRTMSSDFFFLLPCLSPFVRLRSDFLLSRLTELMGRFQGILIVVWNHFKGPLFFFPLSCINSWNEEIGLDFILTSAPQTCAYLKILILNQACFY